MQQPLKSKYHDLYWDMAYAASRQSVAKRLQVGCVIVTPSGLVAPGWNGMPASMDNCCEVEVYTETGVELMTKPELIHAERNAIDKLSRQGVAIEGSILFVTHSPCLECAKSIHGLGFAHIYYDFEYRDTAGIEFFRKMRIPVSIRG